MSSTATNTTQYRPSTTAAAHAAIPDLDSYVPCTRFRNVDGKQEPRLRNIHEPIPEDAECAGPIYLLTRSEFDYQSSIKNPYAIAGSTNIASELQDRCEASGRVLYPLYIESDEYHVYGPEVLIGWFTEFVEECLQLPIERCRFYYTGSRSIHVHLPLIAQGEDEREWVKVQAAMYSDKTGAALDLGIYSRKRQFRLPGVTHQKTGRRKVGIDPAWSRDQIEVASEDSEAQPDTFAGLIADTFTLPQPRGDSAGRTEWFARIVANGRLTIPEKAAPPLIEQQAAPDDPVELAIWESYNRKEFSPYANAHDGTRSVAVLRVLGGAFARKSTRNGATLVPAYFYGAESCNGAFTKHGCYAPLQLSDRDYPKWNYLKGDYVVIIGGSSRNSRIIPLPQEQAQACGRIVQTDGREAALGYLSQQGHDVGRAGRCPSQTTKSASPKKRVPRKKKSNSRAAQIVKQIEAGDIEVDADHYDRLTVANHLMKTRGWNGAWRWFEQQYGERFDPGETWKHLASLVASYPKDFGHIIVPPRP